MGNTIRPSSDAIRSLNPIHTCYIYKNIKDNIWNNKPHCGSLSSPTARLCLKTFSSGSFSGLDGVSVQTTEEKQTRQTGELFLAFQLGVDFWKWPQGTLAQSHAHQVSRHVSQPWPLNHPPGPASYHARPVATPKLMNK